MPAASGPTTPRPLTITGVPSLRALVLDLWSNLNHKAAMEDPRRAMLAKSWMGDENLRRVTAYHLLDSYAENASREFLRTTDDAEKRNHREYGDCSVMVERVVAAILGDEVTVAVDGADVEIPDAPDLPEPPDEPPAGASPTDRRVHALQVERHTAQVEAIVDEWERAWRNQPALQQIQDGLRDWAAVEQLETKLRVGEGKAVGLGDGVFALGWDAEKRRPVLQTYDPRMYFPVLDDVAFRQGFPSRVHLAWEETRQRGGSEQVWVRRITYELVLLAEPRRYPWAPDEDAWWTCTLTDAEWLLQDSTSGWIVDAVAPERAQYRTLPAQGLDERGTPIPGEEIRDLDLMVDFIPLLHVPGVPTDEHFGRSILSRVLQLFDDLQASDSDLQAAAALAGTPMFGLSGESAVPDDLEVAPGAIFKLGPHGRMDSLDASASVEALRHVISDLLQRLSVNISVPGEVLGRVDEVGAESGFARLLKLGPFSSLIGVLRLVRTAKYALLLRMVQRMYQAAGEWDPGATVDARLVFGPFLPTDVQQVIEDVVALLGVKAITVETALRMLVEAGVSIDDIADEAERLRAQDFAGAVQLLEALGDEDAVYEYLRRQAPERSARPEPPPEIDLPQGGRPLSGVSADSETIRR